MARDIQDRVGKVGQFLDSDTGRELVGAAVSELLGGLGASRSKKATKKAKGFARDRTKDIGETLSGALGDGLSGARGLAAGAGAAALAPVAIKGIGKLVKGNASLPSGPKDVAEGAVSKVGDKVKDTISDKIDEAGGASGILKDTVKGALPFGGGDDDEGSEKNDAQGVGKGRRMPIQQSVDVGLPIETVYNQWTQFEEWPKFMHRVTRVSQEDPCKVSFAVKIWGKTKEFTAEIETQRPDDRIRWKTTEGMSHSGVVIFRELGPNLTRVLLSFDLDPGGLLEKYARGARFVKRAARADLHRFAAFIEMLEHETGAWRGTIEDGEVVEDHDSSYDRKREYSSADELLHGSDGEDSDDDEDEDEGEGRNGGDPARRGSRTRSSQSRGRSRAASSRSSSRSAGSGSSSSSRGRSGSGSSRSSSRSSSSRSSSGSSRRGTSSPRNKSSSGRSRSSSGAGKSASGRSSSSSGRSRSGSSRSGSSSSRSGGTSARGGSSSGRGRSSGNSGGSASRSSGNSGSSASRSSASSRSSRSRQRARSGSRS